MKTPLPRCQISTDQGPIEADTDCPDFARLVASLTRRGPGQIEFVGLEHPSGGVLTLGAKTSRDGERLLRFRHVQADGVIHCTKRVAEKRKLVSQLTRFFKTGTRGNSLAWIPTNSLIFDAEEANTRLRQQPHPDSLSPVILIKENGEEYFVANPSFQPTSSPIDQGAASPIYPSVIQGAHQAPLQITLPGSTTDSKAGIAATLILVAMMYSCHQWSAYKEAREQQIEAGERAERKRRHDEEMTKFLREYTPSPTRSSTSGYSSPLGNIWPGTALYHKDTLTQFGFVVDVDSDGVWVADSYKSGASRTSLYARRYARSYITGNFVTK